MKKIILALTVLVFALTASAQQFSKASLQATGLTCALCSNAINKALLALPFIESVKSDIKTSSFQMVFKNDQEVEIDHIRQAVEDAGFSVGKLELTAQFTDVQLQSNKHVSVGNYQFHFLNARQKSLNGEYQLQLADQGFVTAKEFKKINAQHRQDCVKTGKAAACCVNDGMKSGTRVYHVTI